MAKRFKNLNAALGYLRNTGTDDDTPNPKAPEGSQLRQYQDVVSKEKTVVYGARATGSKPGEILKVELQPFAVDPASVERVLVPISKRASDNKTNAGMTEALLNISATITSGRPRRGFIPAKAIIAKIGTGSTTPNSKITGRKYTKKGGNSYTFPYGQGSTTADSNLIEVRAQIVAAVAGLTGKFNVNFTPEVYK